MKRPDWLRWHDAMCKEMASHQEMKTWELEQVSDDVLVIGCLWVFKLKLDSNDFVLQYKARLVAQGFRQIYGLNHTDTFSSVVSFVTLRTLFAVAAFHKWIMDQSDVNTAYLNSHLRETVYMRQLACFQSPSPSNKCLVCKLLRALYGLKRSGLEWFRTLRDFLIQLGFRQMIHNPAVFILGHGADAVVIAVYVDDMLYMGRSRSKIDEIKAAVGRRFKIKDQGAIGQFLGMKVERSPDLRSFFVSQPSYIEAALDRFGLSNAKPTRTPLDPKQKVVPFDGSAPESECKRYQEMIGCLNWLSQASRPDISFPVSILARHSKNPGPLHFSCAKKVFRYLAGTADFRLRIAARSDDDVTAFSDSDLGGDHSVKSTTGFLVSVHGAMVAWGSKLQSLIADSTVQAEIIALWHTSREALAIRYFLEELGVSDTTTPPSLIYCDNQPAIHIITNPVSTKFTRHMERKFLSTREHNERGLIRTTYINTKENPADMLTKPLPAPTLHQHREAIGLAPPAPPSTSLLRGSVAEEA